eukprot:6185631-Pleurochrysis_carterae.AAC.2
MTNTTQTPLARWVGRAREELVVQPNLLGTEYSDQSIELRSTVARWKGVVSTMKLESIQMHRPQHVEASKLTSSRPVPDMLDQ